MIKIAAIIGGVLLMAGVALAGTLTSLDSANSPTIGSRRLRVRPRTRPPGEQGGPRAQTRFRQASC
jgi:hypothetical protein